MSTNATVSSFDKNLYTTLRISGVLTLVGAAIGGAAMTRVAGTSSVLAGAWAGALVANLAVWGVVLLGGLRAALTGRMLASLPSADARQAAAADITRHMEETISPAPATVGSAAQREQAAEREEELQLVA